MQPWLAAFPPSHHPTFFEVVTVMALRYFAAQKCDLVIWEIGLGGRLDATNIVTPLASVITNIEFDHQQWLGDTLDQIAAEKAGIIKTGVPVITAAEPGHGLEVISETARRLAAPFTRVAQVSRIADSVPPSSTSLSVEQAWAAAAPGAGGMPALPLSGEHQRLNAALAVTTVKAIAAQIPVSAEALSEGLKQVSWPGRMQLVKTPAGQTIVLDGAHNAASAAALRCTFESEFRDIRPVLVLGVLGDKDWSSIAGSLASLASRILLVPVKSQRTLPPEALAPVCREVNLAAPVETCASLSGALAATAKEPFLLITGSLYLVGEAMELLRLSAAPPKDERSLNEWSAAR
jgi:dihydrofolate synthase/folylpolyglutamate synthase